MKGTKNFFILLKTAKSLLLIILISFTLSSKAKAGIFDFFFKKPIPQTLSWQYWSNDVFEKAQNEKRPIFLYVKSNICHWCQKMAVETFTDPTVVAAINKNFLPIVADLNLNSDVILQYHLKNLPAILILTPNRQIILRTSGFLSPQLLMVFIDKMLNPVE